MESKNLQTISNMDNYAGASSECNEPEDEIQETTSSKNNDKLGSSIDVSVENYCLEQYASSSYATEAHWYSNSKSKSLPRNFENNVLKATGFEKNKRRIFRRPSLKSMNKFVSRVIRHVSHLSLTGKQSHIEKYNNISSAINEDGPYYSSNQGINRNHSAPIMCGIKNHGNTCYINSVIQCLSNTDMLAEYFVMDSYKGDLARNNKANSRKFGTKGELTQQLAVLLKSLWTGMYAVDISQQFKNVVAKYGSQYRGNNQHDAQEFLWWLLDKVHEDLNSASKKKYRANKSSFGRPDEIVAAEALANHTRCNNSFVHDLFQAQYRSSVTCPSCSRQSNTFDPFLILSLPLPQRYMRPLYITVAPSSLHLPVGAGGDDGAEDKTSCRQQLLNQIGVSLHISSTISDLKEAISLHTHINKPKLVILELYEDSFQRTFADYQSLSIIHDTDDIYCVEISSEQQKDKCVDEVKTGSDEDEDDEHEKLLLILLHRVGAGNQGKRFGGLYTRYIGREASFLDLQNTVLDSVESHIKEPNSINEHCFPLFKLRVHDGIPGKCYLPTDVDHPLYMPTVDRALASCDADPIHLKIVVEWEVETKSKLLHGFDDSIREDATVQELRTLHSQPVTASLFECFDLCTQEEKLAKENAWKCSYCKKLQQATVKLSLWSLPDILIIHLKRFRQCGSHRAKLTTLVDFPVIGLDMTKHIAKHQGDGASASGFSNLSSWSPWRRSRPGRVVETCQERMYDLYAVCNHTGSMTAGHYTAFCKNPADCQWYCFDDSTVTSISDSDVVTEHAYLLFYQRRSLNSTSSSSAVSSASSSTVSSDHWCYRIPDFQPAEFIAKCSQSQNDLLSDPETDGKNSRKSSSRDSGVGCDGFGTIDKINFTRNAQFTASMPVANKKNGKAKVQEYNLARCEIEDGEEDDDDVTLTAKSDDSHDNSEIRKEFEDNSEDIDKTVSSLSSCSLTDINKASNLVTESCV